MSTEHKHTAGNLSVVGNQLRSDKNHAIATVKYAGNEQTEANADRLAHCWNCHDELVAALKLAHELLFRHPSTPQHGTAMTAINNAITKASTP